MRRIGVVFNGPPYDVGEMVGAVRRAEELGFHSAWQAEDPYGPDAVSILACYARATTRIQLGTAVINPITRAPALVASTMATLDQISAGRMILGLGAGVAWGPLIPGGGEGVRWLRLMRETIRVTHQALGDDDLVVDGQRVEVLGRPVNLRRGYNWEPWAGFRVQRPRIPILVGARGPKMVALAATHADGLIIGHSIDAGAVRDRIDAFRSAAAAAGRSLDDLEIAALVVFSPSEDGSVDPSLYDFVAARVARLTDAEVLHYDFDPALLQRIRMRWRDGNDQEAARLVPRDLLDCFLIAGTPEQCHERLREFVTAGVSLPIVMPEACDLDFALCTAAAFATAPGDAAAASP